MHTLNIAGASIKWQPSMTISNNDTLIFLSFDETSNLLEQFAKLMPIEYARWAPKQQPTRDLSRFSTVCPPGYDTIVGWVAKNRYDIVENLGTAAWLHSRDGFWIANRTRNKGKAVEKVVAPPVLREQGIEQVNAYPVEVIAERFAD